MSNLREEIEEIHRKQVAYYGAEDFVGLRSLYAADCKLLSHGRPMMIGPEVGSCPGIRSWVDPSAAKREPPESTAAAKTLLSFFEAGLKSLKIIVEEVGTAGEDVVYSRGVYKLFLEDGKEGDVGKCVALWKRVDGQLYLYTDIFNSDKS